MRWMSPELITPQEFGLKTSRPTKPSDCYSLGMVIYKTITGNLPFHEDTDWAVSVKVVKGEHPHHEVEFSESLWKMVEQCWGSQPEYQPTIQGILWCLETTTSPSFLPPPGVSRGMEVDPGSDGLQSSSVDREITAHLDSPIP